MHEFKTILLKKIFAALLLLGFIAPTAIFASPTSKPAKTTQQDNKWAVGYTTKASVHASVNGQVTHGDGLHVRLIKGHCDMGNVLTFVYTGSKHPKIKQIKGAQFTAKFMGSEKKVKIAHMLPFLVGHRATIEIGWADISALKEALSKQNPIKIEYRDSKKLKISDYFDITHNSWSNTGVREALDKAVEKCRKL